MTRESGSATSPGDKAPAVRLEAAYIDGFEAGRRFGLWFEAPIEKRTHGAILCVQPFGDEATLARRVLCAQARRLALQGWATLLLDPFGTGDSEGRTDEATLALWRADLLRASLLARHRAPGRFVVWGIRMGALLAVNVATALEHPPDAMVFWQPPPTGAALIDPLRKLANVGAVARVGGGEGGGPASSQVRPRADSQSDRAAGGAINLGGYRLRRDLVEGLAGLSMEPVAIADDVRSRPVLMLGIQRVLPADGHAPKLLAGLAQGWSDSGYRATARAVQGEPFWSSLEPSTPANAFDATESFLRSEALPDGRPER